MGVACRCAVRCLRRASSCCSKPLSAEGERRRGREGGRPGPKGGAVGGGPAGRPGPPTPPGGGGGRAVPAVVFVCRDAPRARECARRADLLLSACHAYAGSYPQSWEHPGRARVVFAAERDVHEGRLGGWGVPRLPATLRSETTGDGSPIATAVRAPLPLGSDA